MANHFLRKNMMELYVNTDNHVLLKAFILLKENSRYCDDVLTTKKSCFNAETGKAGPLGFNNGMVTLLPILLFFVHLILTKMTPCGSECLL